MDLAPAAHVPNRSKLIAPTADADYSSRLADPRTQPRGGISGVRVVDDMDVQRTRINRTWGATSACALFAFGTSIANGQDAPKIQRPSVDAFRIIGMTAPVRTATLASVLPARITKRVAHEGAVVHEGDPVVLLDDAVQRARTEMAKAAAESPLDIERAKIRWENANREWERLAKLQGKDSATSKELRDVATLAETRRVEHELAIFEREQAVRAFAREQALLAEYRIGAPFDGYVASHLKQVGETVDQLEGIAVVVQLDPLEVAVDCPLILAPYIEEGRNVTVYPVDEPRSPRPATIAHISRVADGASQTFKVKLTVPNEDAGWMSGLKVLVDLNHESAMPAEPKAKTVSHAAPGEITDR